MYKLMQVIQRKRYMNQQRKRLHLGRSQNYKGYLSDFKSISRIILKIGTIIFLMNFIYDYLIIVEKVPQQLIQEFIVKKTYDFANLFTVAFIYLALALLVYMILIFVNEYDIFALDDEHTTKTITIEILYKDFTREVIENVPIELARECIDNIEARNEYYENEYVMSEKGFPFKNKQILYINVLDEKENKNQGDKENETASNNIIKQA